MRRGRMAMVVWLAAATAPAVAQQTPPSRPTPQQATLDTTLATTATVTFLQGAVVYVGAGRADGLDEGSELYLLRHDTVAATLKVKYVSSHQSASEVVKGASDIAVGESVRYYPHIASATPAAAEAAAAAAAARPKPPRRLSGPGLHGRIGARYLRATTRSEIPGQTTGSSGFSQPSLDLRLDGRTLWSTPLGIAVDLRTRQTTSSSSGRPNQVDGHTRVYQAALLWNAPGAGFRMVAGRQYLSAVSWISLFDGALLEVGSRHVTLGGFGGVEPDQINLGVSTQIQDYGGYIQFHGQSARSQWSMTTGAVGSYFTGASTNREFGFLQAAFSTPVMSFYGLQEIDYYRSAKVALGEKPISFTNVFVNGSLRPARWLSLTGSYDGRRNVRLYRDAVNPATQFDDSFRQGYGGGLQLMGHRIRAFGEWRKSTGGAAGGDATSYTGTLGLDRLTPLRLGFVGRATFYTNANPALSGQPALRNTTGQLYTINLGFEMFRVMHAGLNGGLRREDNPHYPSKNQSTWYGIDMDAALARAWFLSGSALRQRDPLNPGNSTTTQLYAGVTWRF
jgi:hypothetical protein